MRIKDFKLFKKPFSLWLISVILLAISFDGILSFPNLLNSASSITQYIVAGSHAIYVIAGILIIIGFWRLYRFTSIIIIVWGITSLGAGLGGPLAYSFIPSTFLRTAFIITLLICFITSGLFFYCRYIIKNKK